MTPTGEDVVFAVHRELQQGKLLPRPLPRPGDHFVPGYPGGVLLRRAGQDPIGIERKNRTKTALTADAVNDLGIEGAVEHHDHVDVVGNAECLDHVRRQLDRRAKPPPMFPAVVLCIVALSRQRKPRPAICQRQAHQKGMLPRRLPSGVLPPRHHDQVLHLLRHRGVVGRVDRHDPLPTLALGLPPLVAVDLLLEPLVERRVPVVGLPLGIGQATGDRGHMAAMSEDHSGHRLQATAIGGQEEGHGHGGQGTANRLGAVANGLGEKRLDVGRHAQYHHRGLLSWLQATARSLDAAYVLQPRYGVLSLTQDQFLMLALPQLAEKRNGIGADLFHRQ